jgi:hypothetical protein
MPSDQNTFKTLIYKLLFNGLLTSILFIKKMQFIPLNILLCVQTEVQNHYFARYDL